MHSKGGWISPMIGHKGLGDVSPAQMGQEQHVRLHNGAFPLLPELCLLLQQPHTQASALDKVMLCMHMRTVHC